MHRCKTGYHSLVELLIQDGIACSFRVGLPCHTHFVKGNGLGTRHIVQASISCDRRYSGGDRRGGVCGHREAHYDYMSCACTHSGASKLTGMTCV